AGLDSPVADQCAIAADDGQALLLELLHVARHGADLELIGPQLVDHAGTGSAAGRRVSKPIEKPSRVRPTRQPFMSLACAAMIAAPLPAARVRIAWRVSRACSWSS